MSTSKLSGILIRKNLNFTTNELLEFAAGLSSRSGAIEDKLLHWEFGPVMQMRLDVKAQNYLFSPEKVPLHWDGAFYREPAKLLFYCEESDGQGGETLFVNTELLWKSLTVEEQFLCKKVMLTYKTEKKAHYGGKITLPLVQKHPKTGETILRLAEEVETSLNPVTLKISGIPDAMEFYEKMRRKLYEKDFLYVHEWKKGDLVVCDNFTYLHGRNPLRQNLGRSFKRIQIL